MDKSTQSQPPEENSQEIRQRKPSWQRGRPIAAFLILLAAFVFVVEMTIAIVTNPEARWSLVGIFLAAVAIFLIPFGYRFEWTGFGEDVRPKTETQDLRRAKTLWDWLQLLIIPLVITIGGLLFTQAQNERQKESEELRSQEAALQAYIDEIGTLLLDRNLLDAQSTDEVSSLARARTLSVLNRLKPSDPSTAANRIQRIQEQVSNKGPVPIVPAESFYSTLGALDRRQNVILFLYESRLISKGSSVISLDKADLRLALLPGISLSNVDLSGADLSDASMQDSDLEGAKLTNANLLRAKLNGADLRDADLSNANLVSQLCDTKLDGANLSGATLSARLSTCPVTQEQINQAYGDESTELGPDLERPESWSKSILVNE
jgi:hypothetical protein